MLFAAVFLLNARTDLADRTPATTTTAEALAYQEDLPALWEGAEDSGRQAIAASLFERMDVFGAQEAVVTPTPEGEAFGLTAAWSGPLRCSIGSYGRVERLSPDRNDILGTVRLAAARSSREPTVHVA